MIDIEYIDLKNMGLVPAFSTIGKCTSKCNIWHYDAGHIWIQLLFYYF